MEAYSSSRRAAAAEVPAGQRVEVGRPEQASLVVQKFELVEHRLHHSQAFAHSIRALHLGGTDGGADGGLGAAFVETGEGERGVFECGVDVGPLLGVDLDHRGYQTRELGGVGWGELLVLAHRDLLEEGVQVVAFVLEGGAQRS